LAGIVEPALRGGEPRFNAAKTATTLEFLDLARTVIAYAGSGCAVFCVNDRVDSRLPPGDGAHVRSHRREDLSPNDARRLLGRRDRPASR